MNLFRPSSTSCAFLCGPSLTSERPNPVRRLVLKGGPRVRNISFLAASTVCLGSFREREREIVILTETQRELKRDLRTFKADYISADAEDVIQALKTRQRGLNNKVNHTAMVAILFSVRPLVLFSLHRGSMKSQTYVCSSYPADRRHDAEEFRTRKLTQPRSSSLTPWVVAPASVRKVPRLLRSNRTIRTVRYPSSGCLGKHSLQLNKHSITFLYPPLNSGLFQR